MPHLRRAAALLMASILIGFSGGCGTTPATRLAQAQAILAVAQLRTGDLAEVVGQFEAAAQQTRALLADPNLPAEVRTKAEAARSRIEAELATYRPQLEAMRVRLLKIQELIAQAEVSGSDVGLGQEIQIYGQGLTVGSGALPPPFNAYGALAGLLATIVGGVIGSVTRRRKDQAVLEQEKQQSQQQHEQVVQGIVGSVNALIESPAVPDAAAAKKVLQEYQVQNCPAARAAVRKAQGLI